MPQNREYFINKILSEEVKALVKDRFPKENDAIVFILSLYDIAKNEYEDFEENSSKINNTILYTLNNLSQ